MRRVSGVVGAIFLGVIAAACSGELPTAQQYGSPGYRFVIAFAKSPTDRVVAPALPLNTQYGTAVAHRTIWSGGNADVWVDQLTGPVPAQQVAGFLRSYLPVSTEGRIMTRFGFPAATESVACFTPAGSCPGSIAELVILAGTTLYMVHTGSSASTDQAILASFRLVGH